MLPASAQTPLPPVLDQFDLRGDRLEAAQIADRHVLVLAGPGAGKTRLLCAHAAWLASKHEGLIRMLTFSTKAAAEMESRVSQVLAGTPRAARRVAATTLHSFGFQLLKSYPSKLGLPPSIEVLDRAGVEDLALKAARELGMPPDPDFGSRLEKRRRLGQDIDPATDEASPLLVRVEQKMRSAGLVDFGAQITWATRLLRKFPMVLASIHHHDRFLLVDEAQDCDPAQLLFLEALMGNAQEVHLFMVMDPDQSLYGWRDADPERVLAWARKYQPVEYQLTENFRCDASISRLAKYVLDPQTELDSTSPYRLYQARDLTDEAQFVHTQIRERVLNNRPYRRMAVLSRAGWRLDTTREWLSSQGIPLIGGVPIEWSPREKQILIALFALEEWQSQVESGPGSARFLHEVLNLEEEQVTALEQRATVEGIHPCDLLVGDSSQFWHALRNLIEQRLSPLALTKAIGKQLQLDINLLEQDAGLVGVARTTQTTRTLIREVRKGPLRSRVDDGLLVATFHGAKGLEFDTVFIIGCEDGVIPDRRAASANGNAEGKLREERRALYVALTRAAKEVIITWDPSRGHSLSRFLPSTDSDIWQSQAEALDTSWLE